MRLNAHDASLCLWGNSLLPRKAGTLLQYEHTLPLDLAANRVVLATELPGGGCEASDFSTLGGKVVFVSKTASCLPLQSVRLAQAAGVTTYVLLTPASEATAVLVTGPSIVVNISVHSVDPQEVAAFLKIAARFGQHAPNVGYVINFSLSIEDGDMFPVIPPANVTTDVRTIQVAVVEEEVPEMEITTAFGVCIALMAAECVFLVLFVIRQRRDSVQLKVKPKKNEHRELTLPLAVASIGLSVTLLVTIAAVSFTLAHFAGKDSADTATRDGLVAVESTYSNARRNVEDLSDQISNLVVERVLDALDSKINKSETRLLGAAGVFMSYDGTWKSFDAAYLPFTDVANRWEGLMRVFTKQGFFGANIYKTDDRPDHQREDNLTGTVADNDKGWLYGVNSFAKDDRRRLQYWATYEVYEFNASVMLGGGRGDPLLITKDLSEGVMRWHVTERTFPQLGNREDRILQPISVFTPLFSREGHRHGTLECQMQMSSFGTIIKKSMTDAALANMTVLIVDNEKFTILGTNAFHRPKSVGMVLKTSTEHILGVYTVDDFPTVDIKAAGAYLSTPDRWKKHEGRFDQKEYWANQDYLMVMNISVLRSLVADTSSEEWDAEIRGGGCGQCTIYDPELKKWVMIFDGAAVLHIYTNFTTRIPMVSKTRISAPSEPWASSDWLFNDTIKFSDGTVCIAHADPVTPTTTRKACLKRTSVTSSDAYTVSMRVNPSVLYTNLSDLTYAPRLLSDTLHGETNFRLFANGQVFINVVSLGCFTEPFEEPIAVGAWTTVTAVVSVGEYCSVYRDGVLQTKSYFASSYKTMKLGEAYTVGQHYEGRIHGVQMFSLNLTDTEVRSLHTHDAFVRDVPHKEWLVQSKAVDASLYKNSQGISWSVAAMLPVDDIIRRVNSNNVATSQILQQKLRNTDRRLNQKAVESILIIAVIALFAVLIFLTFNEALTKPFAMYAFHMAEASVMNIDHSTQRMSHSFFKIKEILAMDSALDIMLKNLREYRSFLPEAVLLSQRQQRGKVANAPGRKSGVAAIVFTDIENSTQLWESWHDGMRVGLRLHNEIIRKCIDKFEGYEVKTIGDAFMVTFETFQQGLLFSMEVQESLSRVDWKSIFVEHSPSRCVSREDTVNDIRVRIGANFGPVSVEYNDVTHRFDYFGTTVNRAARLEACCKGGSVAVVDEVLEQDKDWKPADVAIQRLGKVVLKGFSDPVFVTTIQPRSIALADSRRPVQNPLTKDATPPRDGTWSCTISDPASDTLSQNSDVSSRSAHSRHWKESRLGLDGLRVVDTATIAHVEPHHDYGKNPFEVTAEVNNVLARIVSSLERTDGQIIGVMGGGVLAGWNVMKPCGSHLEGCFRFVGVLSKSCRLYTARVGCSSGKVFTGYVGTTGQRFVTAVGVCINQASALFYRCCALNLECLFANNEGFVTNGLINRGYIRPVERFELAGKVVTAYEVHKQKIREWCDNKFDTLINANDGKAKSAGTTPETPEGRCWSQAYVTAFHANDIAELTSMAAIDPSLRKVIAMLAVQPTERDEEEQQQQADVTCAADIGADIADDVAYFLT